MKNISEEEKYGYESYLTCYKPLSIALAILLLSLFGVFILPFYCFTDGLG